MIFTRRCACAALGASSTRFRQPARRKSAACFGPSQAIAHLRIALSLLLAFLPAVGCYPAAAEPAVATTARQVHQMPPDEADESIPVHLVAIVTYYEPGDHLLFVSDASGSVFVWATENYPIHVGDQVEIQGVTEHSLRTQIAGGARIRVISSRHSVPVVPAGFGQFMAGEMDCRLVSIHGVVRSASLEVHGTDTVAQLQMLVHGGTVQVYVQNSQGIDLPGLLDAEVFATGVAGAEFNARFQTMRPKLFVSDARQLTILRRPRVNPLDLPLTDIDKVMESQLVVNESPRIRVQGAVTAFDPGYSLVIQHEGRSLLAVTRQTDKVSLGDVVDVIGFAGTHAYSSILEDAQFYLTGRTASVAPRPSTYAQAISGVDSDALITLSGQVLSELRSEISDTLVIVVDRHPVSVVLRRSDNRPPLPYLPPGTLVQVNGICRVTPGIDWHKPVLFRLDLRGSDDLKVLSRPSWWNVRHLIAMGSALLACFFLILIWVAVLRRRVADQTKRIERSIQVERERSRLLEKINSDTPLDMVLSEICGSIELLIPNVRCSFCLSGHEAEIFHEGAGEVDDQPRLEPLIETVLTDAREKLVGTFRVERLPGKVVSSEDHDTLAAGVGLASLAVHQRRMYEELNYHSTHDQLTGLPNRRLADQHLEEAVELALQTGMRVGVAYIDVDHFKQVNDRHGHKVGDLYLQQIASRLGSKVRASDLLARIGGDEFLLVAATLQEMEDGETYKRRLRACFEDVFVLDGVRVHGSASIGFAVCPDHGATSERLKRHADAEMYAAKHRERTDEEQGPEPGRPPAILSPSDLRCALENSQFRLFYQPQFSSDGQFRGLEALLRLHDPILGIVAPDAFIDVAEKSDIIFPLGAWVLRQALTDAVEWQLGLNDGARMVVNVSARQLNRPDFADEVALALDESGVPASLLELEITERAVISEVNQANRQLATLRSIGVHISIDDFGTAHSCLSLLHKLQVDTLKIDRSFVRSLGTEPAVLPIIQAIVSLAQSLGKRVVAEGVENEEEFQTLLRLGEMDFQGYLFSRPVPSETVAASLAEWRKGVPARG